MLRVTEQEEPNTDKREALNCFRADHKCTQQLNKMCMEQNYEVWKVCPANERR
jgi:hypothetical protein